MAWNKQTNPTATAANRKKSGFRPTVVKGGLAAVVVVAGAVLTWVILRPNEKIETEKVGPSVEHRIKEVTPSAAGKYKEEVKKEVVKTEPKKVSPMRDKRLTPDQRLDAYEKELKEMPLPKASSNRLFRSGLEQVMSWVFTTEVGDAPPPLPHIPDFDIVHLQEILEHKNEVTEDDTDEHAAAKEVVDYAKQELKKYLEKGGDPDEFLQFYHDQLKNAYQQRTMATEEVMKVLTTEPELVNDYLKKVNASLAEKGIKGVNIPARIAARYGVTIETETKQDKAQEVPNE